MCHEWWLRRRDEEREASRRMWDEFDRTQPLSEAEVTAEEAELRLEQQAPTPLAAKDCAGLGAGSSRSSGPPRAFHNCDVGARPRPRMRSTHRLMLPGREGSVRNRRLGVVMACGRASSRRAARSSGRVLAIVLVAAIWAALPTIARADWPVYGHDLSNSRNAGSAGPPPSEV